MGADATRKNTRLGLRFAHLHKGMQLPFAQGFVRERIMGDTDLCPAGLLGLASPSGEDAAAGKS
jgi:hypothetical protein